MAVRFTGHCRCVGPRSKTGFMRAFLFLKLECDVDVTKIVLPVGYARVSASNEITVIIEGTEH